MTTKEFKFKQQTLAYLAKQGYKLTWNEVIQEYDKFWDNPQGDLQNQIDTCFATTDKELNDFINEEILKLPKYNIS